MKHRTGILVLTVMMVSIAGRANYAEWGESQHDVSTNVIREQGSSEEISEEDFVEAGGFDMNATVSDEDAILIAFKKMQQAMIDKDMDTMTALVTEDKTFTHMSGKTQTKEEFFGEIADGTLNYYKSEIQNPVVTVDGDTAVLTADTTLTAKVYGMSGTWTLHTTAHYIKVDGEWIQCN